MASEIWKPVKDFEGLYEVSNLGRIKSLARIIDAKSKIGTPCKRKVKERILKNGKDGHGYPCVNLCGKKKKAFAAIHRLVAEAFIPKIEGKNYVNHIDSDCTNNHVENLEWCTSGENNSHGWKHGNRIAVNAKPLSMFSLSGEHIRDFNSVAEASRNTGVCETGIRNCCKNKPKYKTAGGYKWQYKRLFCDQEKNGWNIESAT